MKQEPCHKVKVLAIKQLDTEKTHKALNICIITLARGPWRGPLQPPQNFEEFSSTVHFIVSWNSFRETLTKYEFD